MRLIPLLNPPLHLPDLPLMRSPNKVRLPRNIQDPITIPMMAGPGNQHLVLAVSKIIMGLGCVRPVVTDFIPDVLGAVDEREARRGDVEAAV